MLSGGAWKKRWFIMVGGQLIYADSAMGLEQFKKIVLLNDVTSIANTTHKNRNCLKISYRQGNVDSFWMVDWDVNEAPEIKRMWSRKLRANCPALIQTELIDPVREKLCSKINIKSGGATAAPVLPKAEGPHEWSADETDNERNSDISYERKSTEKEAAHSVNHSVEMDPEMIVSFSTGLPQEYITFFIQFCRNVGGCRCPRQFPGTSMVQICFSDDDLIVRVMKSMHDAEDGFLKHCRLGLKYIQTWDKDHEEEARYRTGEAQRTGEFTLYH